MNHVERFKAVMNFQPVDRLPRIEWAAWWDKTIQRWSSEGLALSDRYKLYEHFGLDMYYQYWFAPRGPGLAHPKAHGQGVIATMDEYLANKQHLYPPFDAALEVMAKWGQEQARGDAVIWISLDGFFWFPRSLFGIEPHMYAFYDQPELMHRMNQDLTDYNIRILRALPKASVPTFMTFGEDMSYNHGPMLSRALFEEFLAPYYRQIVPVLKEMGTTVMVDSDGDVTELMPWLLAVGVEGIAPLERQAGVDAMKLRQSHPRMGMLGHYDKMVMPRGEAAMRAEFERLTPVMKSGGFIPSVDHQTPPGVSLEQYRIYLRLLKEYTVAAHP